MKFRPLYWSFIVFTPFVIMGLLTLGRRYDDNIGGVLLQVMGSIVGISWTTWMFLEIGQALTRVFSAGSSETEEHVDEFAPKPQPKPRRPGERRAA